jgi:hypothetical protein
MKQKEKYEVEGMEFDSLERAKNWATAYAIQYGVVPEINKVVELEEGYEWIH